MTAGRCGDAAVEAGQFRSYVAAVMANWSKHNQANSAGTRFAVRWLFAFVLFLGFSAQPLCPHALDSGQVPALQNDLHAAHSGQPEGKAANPVNVAACAAACAMPAVNLPANGGDCAIAAPVPAAAEASDFRFETPAPGPRPPMPVLLTA